MQRYWSSLRYFQRLLVTAGASGLEGEMERQKLRVRSYTRAHAWVRVNLGLTH